MPAKKPKVKKGKPKPTLYKKKRRFNVSPIVLISVIALVIMVGSVLGVIRFEEEPVEEIPEIEPEPEPLVPKLPEIKEKTFLTDGVITSLTSNGTYFIRLIAFPTTQFGIDLVRFGRRDDVTVEKIIYPKECSESKNPSVNALCPQDQNLLPIVAIYRPDKSPIVSIGKKTVSEIEELMNGTIVPDVDFYQEECNVCPRIFNPFLLSLPGTVYFDEIEKETFLESGGDSYPSFVLRQEDLIFQDYAQNLNLFILENRPNVTIKQIGTTILMSSNPTATFNKECNNSLIHFYSPDCKECMGYSLCEVLNETNQTITQSLVGEIGDCEFYEGIRQIMERYPEINYEETCVGPLCENYNETLNQTTRLMAKYSIQTVPTLIYNCKYREESFQINQEERIVRVASQLNPDLNITFGEDLANITVSPDTNSTLLSDAGSEE